MTELKVYEHKFIKAIEATKRGFHALCSTVIKDSYNRTSAYLIGHDNLIGHNKSNSSSINMACSTFNASNSLLDIQPDKQYQTQIC